jgi:hypothetical protein
MAPVVERIDTLGRRDPRLEAGRGVTQDLVETD